MITQEPESSRKSRLAVNVMPDEDGGGRSNGIIIVSISDTIRIGVLIISMIIISIIITVIIMSSSSSSSSNSFNDSSNNNSNPTRTEAVAARDSHTVICYSIL